MGLRHERRAIEEKGGPLPCWSKAGTSHATEPFTTTLMEGPGGDSSANTAFDSALVAAPRDRCTQFCVWRSPRILQNRDGLALSAVLRIPPTR